MRVGNKARHAALAALLAAIAVVACSGGDGDQSGTASGSGGATTGTAASAATASSLQVLNGDEQKGLTGATLRQVVLLATDNSGAAVAGATLQFEVTSGSGSLSSASATTDDTGQATVVPVLGAQAGALHLRATVKGTTVTARMKMTAVDPDPDSAKAPSDYNPDWTAASHSIATPDYGKVLPQDQVNRIEIRMSAAQWASIREDMKAIFGGDFGAGGQNGGIGMPPTGASAPVGGLPPGASAPVGGPPLGASAPTGGASAPVGGNGGVMTIGSGQDPSYVAVTVSQGGKVWKQVGFRLKGNSTLSSQWSSGSYKLPFRLKFNAFDDIYYPGIYRQRFHGFKELSFSAGARDTTQLHEKLASDLLRRAGVPAARSAFYRVYLDIGTGLVYNGLYTALEIVDDTLVPDQFAGDTTGNIYKPESTLQTFRKSEFAKKNNDFAADYSDVAAFIAALNSSQRRTDAAGWRAALESTFDADGFLKWLAANNAMVNWDTYGGLAHNYYLYRARSGQLTWIPWDHNEALTGSPGITGGSAGSMGIVSNGLSLSMNEVTSSWPLLRYLADDPVYFERYRQYLKQFSAKVFVQSEFDALVDKHYGLIAPYIIGPDGELPTRTNTTEAEFRAGPATLKAHVSARRGLIESYVP